MQTAAFILGAIGTLTGSISLIIRLIEFYNDRARLVIEVSLCSESSPKAPIEYFTLRVIFINRGRRPITVIDGAIDLPAENISFDGKSIPVISAIKPLFKAGIQAGLTIEPHNRRELVFEPFDASLLRHCDGKARAFFTDAIGNRYDTDFIVPAADRIVRITSAWKELQKKQKSETTNATNKPDAA